VQAGARDALCALRAGDGRERRGPRDPDVAPGPLVPLRDRLRRDTRRRALRLHAVVWLGRGRVPAVAEQTVLRPRPLPAQLELQLRTLLARRLRRRQFPSRTARAAFRRRARVRVACLRGHHLVLHDTAAAEAKHARRRHRHVRAKRGGERQRQHGLRRDDPDHQRGLGVRLRQRSGLQPRRELRQLLLVLRHHGDQRLRVEDVQLDEAVPDQRRQHPEPVLGP
jgi:hypothetical protein